MVCKKLIKIFYRLLNYIKYKKMDGLFFYIAKYPIISLGIYLATTLLMYKIFDSEWIPILMVTYLLSILTF
jgi:hypothetical protein